MGKKKHGSKFLALSKMHGAMGAHAVALHLLTKEANKHKAGILALCSNPLRQAFLACIAHAMIS